MKGLQFSFADGAPMLSTLREVRQLANDWSTWRVLALVSVIVGLVGPFGTFGNVALVERLAYWGLLVVGSFFLVTFSLGLSDGWLARRLRSKAVVVTLGALVAAAPVSLFILGVGYLFGMNTDGSDLPVLYRNAAAVTLGVSLLFLLLQRVRQPVSNVGAPAIQRRLPMERRGALIRMSVHDHYVEVVTAHGTSLVLMRLRDAMAETAPSAGLQVHRSHWVAFDGVVGCRRENGRVLLEMRDGFAVPVSRSFMRAARDAGLVG